METHNEAVAAGTTDPIADLNAAAALYREFIARDLNARVEEETEHYRHHHRRTACDG